MITTSVVPDFALGLAKDTRAGIESAELDKWPAEQLALYNVTCRSMRDLFVSARKNIEAELFDGVDAKAFVARYEKTIGLLDAILAQATPVAQTVKIGRRTEAAEELVSNFKALAGAATELHRFLSAMLAIANAPGREIDWRKIEESEAAYQRGETKPFRPLADGKPFR
jgi:hypothetical protein